MGRSIRAVVTAACLALPLLALVSAPSVADNTSLGLPWDNEPAVLSGFVRDEGGAGLPGVRVVAQVLPQWNDWPTDEFEGGPESNGTERLTTTTDDGSFRLSVPAPAVYRLEFRPPLTGPLSVYKGAFWGDESVLAQGTDVAVEPDRDYSGFDVTLERGRGEISGEILYSSGAPLTTGLHVLRDGHHIGNVFSDEAGRFRFPADPGVPYQVWQQGSAIGYFPTWFPGVVADDEATDIVVGESGTADASFRVVGFRDSTVTGRITTADGQPLAGMYVTPIGVRDHEGAPSDADGNYTVSVPSGNQRLCAVDPAGVYAGQCWGPTRFALDTTPITLERWETRSDIDFSLERSASVSATEPDGKPSAAIPYVWDTRTQRWRNTAVSGMPSLGLAPGRYRFRVQPDLWWPSAATIDGAEDVVLAGGERLTLRVSVEMPDCRSSIAGRIVDRRGEGRYVQVHLIAVDPDGRRLPLDDPGHFSKYWYLDETFEYGGNYEFNRLQPGRYRIRYGSVDRWGRSDMAGWWPHRDTFSEAGDLVIDGPGVQLTSVDSSVVGGKIEYPSLFGTVVDARGTPVANAHAELWRFDDEAATWGYASRATTDAFGRFGAYARTGDFRIRVVTPWHPGLGSSWWTTGSSPDPATVRVSAGVLETEVGTAVVHDSPSSADPDSTPPPGRPLPPVVEPTRTECPGPVGPTGPPVETPATQQPQLAPLADQPIGPDVRRGRLRVWSPLADIVLVRNREAVRVRMVIGGRRITVAPQDRRRIRFARERVVWRATWPGGLIEDVRGRVRVR